MNVAKRIEEKLRRAFAPQHLEVIDESAAHAGHAGVAEMGEGARETHFQVQIVSDAFEGKSRLDRQRSVNAVLAEELSGPVHALSIRARAPAEVGH
ncbi:BolA family protein [Marinibaculum pumilum]|uniref:BolA family protein n=1 Tax=Marinibaculum pumilum TaxID=1766165 RepID=A0ABV7KX45_9PROT